ncbi:MAG: bifunctional indole-3-glycerol phosphate synthase/phosphoribosylanthranilate isomerase [Spirochaetota bacterium]
MKHGSDIRKDIVTRRRQRVSQEGAALGADIPASRNSMVVPMEDLVRKPFVICEIKRASPSRGTIKGNLNPAKQAQVYKDHGARVLSVLTEEDYFGGSLDDLMEARESCPHLPILRKDFLFCPEDIEISYRAGADLVLLIASLLSGEQLERLYHMTLNYGMFPLVEVHSKDDIEKVSSLAPMLVGINSRDLATFTIDPLLPVYQAQHITWPATLIFESGIRDFYDARFAGSQGFSALLVGEHLVNNPERIQELQSGLDIGIQQYNQRRHADFWSRLVRRARKRPCWVKVCGITNRADAELAMQYGADMLGFVLADSPRKVTLDFIATLKDLPIIKCAVVVHLSPEDPLAARLTELVASGVLDVVQLHGNQSDEQSVPFRFPWYKAVSSSQFSGDQGLPHYHCPRILLDAGDETSYGGTGRRASDDAVQQMRSRGPLWLAGGITPDNVRDVIHTYQPELIDLSSGLESEYGKKDPQKMETFFQQLEESKHAQQE